MITNDGNPISPQKIETAQIGNVSGDMVAMEKVKQLIAKNTTYDSFGNCIIDLTNSTEFVDKYYTKAFKEFLPSLIDNGRKNAKHLLNIKITSKQPRLYKHVLNQGFVFHQGHREFTLMNLCLKGDDPKKCSFPKFKATSIGVSGVVFNKDLSCL